VPAGRRTLDYFSHVANLARTAVTYQEFDNRYHEWAATHPNQSYDVPHPQGLGSERQVWENNHALAQSRLRASLTELIGIYQRWGVSLWAPRNVIDPAKARSLLGGNRLGWWGWGPQDEDRTMTGKKEDPDKDKDKDKEPAQQHDGDGTPSLAGSNITADNDPGTPN
jgi:hypothetical protein